MIKKVKAVAIKSMEVKCDECSKIISGKDVVFCGPCWSTNYAKGKRAGQDERMDRKRGWGNTDREDMGDELLRFLKAMDIPSTCPMGVLMKALPNDDARKSIIRLTDMILTGGTAKGD